MICASTASLAVLSSGNAAGTKALHAQTPPPAPKIPTASAVLNQYTHGEIVTVKKYENKDYKINMAIVNGKTVFFDDIKKPAKGQ